LVATLGTTILVIFFLIILYYSIRKTPTDKESNMKNKEKSWYSDKKGRELDKDALLSLYARYHDYMGECLNRHFNVRNYYTALLSALSGLYIGGILQLVITGVNVSRWSMPHYVLFVLPVTIIVLSVWAIKSTTRYYSAFLRRVVLIAKIENMLGLDNQVKTKKENRPRELVWEKDEKFMVKYYWKSRKDFKESEEFIENKKWKGDNLWATLTFVSFFGIGTFLLILHILWF